MKFLKLSLLLALLVAACVPGVAQTQQLQLNIPFDFMVKGKILPAGHYIVRRGTIDDDVWTIESGHGSAMFLTNPVESQKVAHGPSLIFLKAGDQYALLQIWDSGHAGRELLMSNVKQTMVAQNTQIVEINAE
ncbi:MAG TPA: hypothetical protein VMH03_15630 [Terriglobales bacterium]|nr:hypothetical protein [Terriglobales bacterium]